MKPAVDQSLSKIAYLLSVVFRGAIGDAETNPVKGRAILMNLKNCIITAYKLTKCKRREVVTQASQTSYIPPTHENQLIFQKELLITHIFHSFVDHGHRRDTKVFNRTIDRYRFRFELPKAIEWDQLLSEMAKNWLENMEIASELKQVDRSFHRRELRGKISEWSENGGFREMRQITALNACSGRDDDDEMTRYFLSRSWGRDLKDCYEAKSCRLKIPWTTEQHFSSIDRTYLFLSILSWNHCRCHPIILSCSCIFHPFSSHSHFLRVHWTSVEILVHILKGIPRWPQFSGEADGRSFVKFPFLGGRSRLLFCRLLAFSFSLFCLARFSWESRGRNSSWSDLQRTAIFAIYATNCHRPRKI